MSEVRTIYLKEPHTPAKLINFIKTTGSVKKDERIAIYEFKETLEDGEMRLTRNFLLSEFEGSLTTLMQPGSTILASSEIAQVVEVCGHSIQFSGLCAICGKDLSMYIIFNLVLIILDRIPLELKLICPMMLSV